MTIRELKHKLFQFNDQDQEVTIELIKDLCGIGVMGITILPEKVIIKIEEFIEKINFTELHRNMILTPKGGRIWIYKDGSQIVEFGIPLPTSKTKQPIAVLNTEGLLPWHWSDGNIYAYSSFRDMYITEGGKTLTKEEVFNEILYRIQWDSMYRVWKNLIIKQITQYGGISNE